MDIGIRLNLGSGDRPMNGFVNLDIKNGQQCYPLDNYGDGSIDEIRASHILEHFGRADVQRVLENWASKLKPGGVLKIAVPDFEKISRGYLAESKMDTAGYVMGGQTDGDDFHKSLFDKSTLIQYMRKAGIDNIQEWTSEIKDCASLPISLNLEGTKKIIDVNIEEVGYLLNNGEMSSDNAKILSSVMREIGAKKKNVYSQYGEDGIIEEIFKRIGTENKWCLEVGAADGIKFSNTRRLVEAGWDAILIENNPSLFENLKKNSALYQRARCFGLEVNTEGNSLDKILSDCGAPKDIDLMCIDIDGQDFHIWNSLLNYRPRVIMVEFDPNVDKNFIPTIRGVGQAGERAICELGASKDYKTVLKTDVNGIFIRRDCSQKLLHTVFDTKLISADNPIKISAVMSMPRLCFTSNMNCVMQTFFPMGINFMLGTGVFWGQILTRMIQGELDKGVDYIFVVDYDTWFTKNHVMRLSQLIIDNPQYDAIVPPQVQRDSGLTMMSKRDGNGELTKEVNINELKNSLMEISSGHFGLTVFNAKSFNKLKKPWFVPLPAPDGGWGDGRMDEDMYFWDNWRKCGLKTALANDCKIGHMDLMASFPGNIDTDFKAEHYYLKDVNEGKIKNIEPKVELLK